MVKPKARRRLQPPHYCRKHGVDDNPTCPVLETKVLNVNAPAATLIPTMLAAIASPKPQNVGIHGTSTIASAAVTMPKGVAGVLSRTMALTSRLINAWAMTPPPGGGDVGSGSRPTPPFPNSRMPRQGPRIPRAGAARMPSAAARACNPAV